MPELPEVETTIRGLALHLEDRILTSVRTMRPDMRRPFPAGLGQTLVGARVTGLGRRAKFGLIHTDRARTLIFHLGMSGRWRIDPETPDKHDHLTIETETNRFALNDPRRFGWVDLVDTAELDSWPSFASMGPEPLGPALTPAYLKGALAGRRQAIKLLLLDQRIVAGLGNIYVCEALWRARISPKRAGGRVSLAALERLVPAIREVLEQSIRDGGSSLRDFVRPDGELGYFATRFDVYGRTGQVCRREDGGLIRRFEQGGRSSWYCPRCQR
ncbi:bifunctional DNA-formamidopyrimidine glycosylase/DNA-(apurinic or apyrimidinic site) lyase [Alteriqipengyuania lutimaris]|uniref:Formamidopyrimidine-DNA glycosylase n=1 Tax=Alteriqipengyuania lutimaris TaxID=1538146 RepID=A0A395LI81_9SPHN|nr:bifunctional DNA-formamidopyrimidine glycosylase/DNA-(apurinic or apyrimidinic site) lyase [Alteriqipengyuania lutimaris]MBB3034772.1 formamidopyrimidine-DNA glycosylase [Alteriqipengyuania lutimaris]RDS76381.1 bifunctional DNA-formamidopyrimidine glycosylase/DNA-(apurinic or apyrimidinic site) lyase [Alteriqipengyuania lutimaris]